MTGEKAVETTVYNIPSGRSFVDSLAQGIWQRVQDDPLKLAEYTILLPSRRACRSLRDAFLRLSEGQPLLLPRMQPLGDVDADELTITLAANENAEALLDIPPAISRLRRQLLLARAIEKMYEHDEQRALSFDQAASLALELGHLLDQTYTEQISFDKLQNLVPENFASHWQEILTFLQIITEQWPNLLKAEGKIDYAERRNFLLEAQVKQWQQSPPSKMIIAAGSTGSIPATAKLLATVATLPNGEVVLPGLDPQMDQVSWQEMGEDHPQYNLKQLLNRIKIDRHHVKDWPVRLEGSINQKRVRLLIETMRPAKTTEEWRQLKTSDIDETALQGLSLVEAATAQEEADVIALMMRETLEHETKTATLITPDRRLARRVTMALRRWGVMIDDSGGQNLADSSVGRWLRLTAQMVLDQMSPVALLACLKHVLAANGMAAADFKVTLQKLEHFLLRGPRPAPGFAGLYDVLDLLAVEDSERKRQSVAELKSFLQALEEQVADFQASLTTDQPFMTILQNHIRLAEALACTDQDQGAQRLWRHEDGEAAAQFINELYQVSEDIPKLSGDQYLALLNTLMKGKTVRPKYGRHPRLTILGQIEARLYNADLVIIGGLNEGTWPSETAGDPWMSRQMRTDFGLPSLERAISLAAHDFVQATTAPEVVVTRAKRVEGSPTVPARWLLRMETVLAAVGLEMPRQNANQWRRWVQALDQPADIKPISRPEPRPPVSARPRQISVTGVERWMQDPYEIYAKYILKLRKLSPLDQDPSAADRGILLHSVLERFIAEYARRIPENAYDKFLEIGRSVFEEMHVPPEIKVFWWGRFEKMARSYLNEEHQWRETTGAVPVLTEGQGQLTLQGPAGAFKLTAKADRIDRLAGGAGLAIIDYKSGQPPTGPEVKDGKAPQLPLEALIAEAGGFDGLAASQVASLVYWHMSERVLRKDVTAKNVAQDLIEEAQAGLQALIDIFDNPQTPYLCRPRLEWAPKYSDYEHFSRIKEWGASGEGEL